MKINTCGPHWSAETGMIQIKNDLGIFRIHESKNGSLQIFLVKNNNPKNQLAVLPKTEKTVILTTSDRFG